MKYLLIFICIFLFFIMVKKSYSATYLHTVKNVYPDGILEVSNGKKYILHAIKIPNDVKDKTNEFLKSTLSRCKVIIEEKGIKEVNIDSAVFYLWGCKDIEFKDSPNIRKGFSDVKVGFWDVQKGLSINLNMLLVQKGFAVEIQ